MSKIVFFSLMLMCSAFLIAQPCTPDQSIPNAGIFPAKLNNADLNVSYQQVIQFKAPLDTTAFVPQLGTTLPIEIDSIRVLDVLGLPPGMTYACNNNSCMINGGQVGCLLISGTCSTPGGYPLRVIIKTSAKAVIGVTKIPQTQIDTNTRYGIFVNWATGLTEVITDETIKVYPNPANDILMIEGVLNQRLLSITISDALGKKIFTQEVSRDSYAQPIDIAQLDKGMYSIEIKAADQVVTKRFLKE